MPGRQNPVLSPVESLWFQVLNSHWGEIVTLVWGVILTQNIISPLLPLSPSCLIRIGGWQEKEGVIG